ncbi:MAG: hypothetical protein KJP02_08395 [Octadecabacter sp.]|nr:hypothetical protein [Octadecabacter sp.]
MRTFMIGLAVFVSSATSAIAGISSYAPPTAGNSDATGALILLVLIGAVVLMGAGACATATQNDNSFEADDDDDDVIMRF